MTDPTGFNDPDNWTGGFYELALELGPRDDARVDRALRAVWREAAVEGAFEEVQCPGSLPSGDRASPPSRPGSMVGGVVT